MINQQACVNMIKQQLRTGDVLDENILALYDKLPRDGFAPKNMQKFAYSDLQIPLKHEQRMWTPLEEAKLLQALALNGTETVLEIGTGTGYLTALLSCLSKKVITIDYYEDFTLAAQKKLQEYQCNNVELITGDGCQGWLDKAPYDVIIMTGAIEKITETLRLQILPGGKLFAIIGQNPIMKALLFTLDHEEKWTEVLLFETCIPPLINKFKPNVFVF